MKKVRYSHEQIIGFLKEAEAGMPIIERFNRTYREELLDLYLFNDLQEV